MASVAEEGVCAKAQRCQRIEGIYEISIVKVIRGRAFKQDQMAKGLKICSFFRDQHLRETSFTLLVRIKGFPDMANCLD